MKECIKNCTDDTGVVCGTNGINFPNICYLEYFMCLSPNIKLLYKGGCGELFEERQKDRKTERQKDRETERQRDRETERKRDRETER
jgi:hypothetical protein